MLICFVVCGFEYLTCCAVLPNIVAMLLYKVVKLVVVCDLVASLGKRMVATFFTFAKNILA